MEGVVLVDFYAIWCGPCKRMAPILKEFAEEMKEKLIVGKLDVDKNGKISDEYRVRSLPTLVLFKDGKEVKRKTGLISKKELKEFVSSVL